jgi:hypothetical protein
VFALPFLNCKKWSSFRKVVEQACFYLEDLGPYVKDGKWDVMDAGIIVTRDSWSELVRPGWNLALVIRRY